KFHRESRCNSWVRGAPHFGCRFVLSSCNRAQFKKCSDCTPRMFISRSVSNNNAQGEILRSDMHKVVTERPRHGHRNRSQKWGGRVAEDYDGRTFVSSARRRQYGWYAKEFSDFLAPLRRYLRAQVGRPWDKVYSEIRKAVPNGLHGDH